MTFAKISRTSLRLRIGCALSAPLLASALGCAAPKPAEKKPEPVAAPKPPPEPDPRILATALSEEAQAMLRSEGELLWQRWTSGAGASPASAAAGHERLYEKPALEALASAEAKSDSADEKRAFALVREFLWPQAIAKAASAAESAFEQARAQLAFGVPPDARDVREAKESKEAKDQKDLKPEQHSERELDRLLTDEPIAAKRAAIAEAEAEAAATLAPLALARDRAEEEARTHLGLPAWPEMMQALQGNSPEQLAQLAEATLAATQEVATRAVTDAAKRNLGQPLEQVRRADLPRLVRSSEADAELIGPKGWDNTRATFGALGLDPLALAPSVGTLRVDGEPAPAKASRPLALLVDPPADVRLSVKSTGGFDEQRALLHETARALGGALTKTSRWESAQLGDGSAAEGIAWLVESLAGDPAWLREHTGLRGQPLNDLVHTEATRRLLSARRAAALVLFEVQRRGIAQTPEAQDELYRSLLTRATLAQHGPHEGGRWPLETDGWMKAAVTLRAALLGANLAIAFEKSAVPAVVDTSTIAAPTTPPSPNPVAATTSTPASAAAAPPVWWHAQTTADALKKLWAQGRALTAEDAAKQSAASLDAKSLASLIDARLAYLAPEQPPTAPRPDYKYMQGDHKVRRRKHKNK